MRRLFSIFLTLIFCLTVSFGCTLLPNPVDKFDATQYVFIGEVKEIISRKYLSNELLYDRQNRKYYASKALEDAFGIKVELTEKVNLPESVTSFEVFPLHLTGSCGLAGWNQDELLKHFPVGAKVAIVAQEARLIEGKFTDNVKVLEIPTFNNWGLTKIDAQAKSETSSSSIYNYRDDSQDGRTEATYSLIKFELAKDLLRLERAESEIEKVKVLQRLLYYPNFWSLDFTKIVHREIKDEGASGALVGQWEARKQSLLNKK